MKKFLTVLIFCLMSNSAFAEKLQGTFFCELKFSDGSGSKFTMKINGSDMSKRDVRDDKGTKYKEVFFADHYDKMYTVFVSLNINQSLYIVSPTEKKNRISFTYVDPLIYMDESAVGKGMCDRI
jgi:hypothetical protein